MYFITQYIIRYTSIVKYPMSLSSEAGAKRQRASQVINKEMGARRATKSDVVSVSKCQMQMLDAKIR